MRIDYHTDNGPTCGRITEVYRMPGYIDIPKHCVSSVYTYTVHVNCGQVSSFCHGCHTTNPRAFDTSNYAPLPTNAATLSRIHRNAAHGIYDDGQR